MGIRMKGMCEAYKMIRHGASDLCKCDHKYRGDRKNFLLHARAVAAINRDLNEKRAKRLAEKKARGK
jgi:hypothetical protein